MEHKRGKNIVCLPGQGEAVSLAGMIFYEKAAGMQTAGQYGVVEILVSPGAGHPPHRHAAHETLLVLEGEFSVVIEDDHYGGGPGTFIGIAPNRWHSFRNTGSGNGRLLATFVPAGIECYLKESAHVVTDRTAPPVPPDPEDEKRLDALGSKYGVETRRS